MTAYVCLLEATLELPHADSLKEKRKLVKSLCAQIRQRFGAAVSEIASHDDRRRAVILCAIVGGSETPSRGDEIARFIEARAPATVVFERDLRTLADIRD